MDNTYIKLKKRHLIFLFIAHIFLLSSTTLNAQQYHPYSFIKEWQSLSSQLHHKGIGPETVNQYKQLHYQWRNSFNNAEEFASGGNFNFLSNKSQKAILDTIFQRDCKFVVNESYSKDSLLKAEILFFIARSEFFLRSFRPALSCFDKALSFSGAGRASIKNDILEAIADTYEEIAEYEIAIAHYRFLLPKYIHCYGKTNHRTALLYEKIGICYAHIEDERHIDTIRGHSINTLAHQYFLKAYEANRRCFHGDNRYSAINLFQLGINEYYKTHHCRAKQRIHYVDTAIALLKKATTYLEKYYPEEVKLGNIYNALSFCYNAKGNPDSLLHYMAKSYRAQLQNRGKNHPMTILSTLYYSTFNYHQYPDSALFFLQEAMSYCVPGFHPQNVFENPDENMYIIDDFMFSLINNNKINRFLETYNITKESKYLYAATKTAELNLNVGKKHIKMRHLSAETGDWSKELNQKTKQVFRTYTLKYQSAFSPGALDTALNILEENSLYLNVLKESAGIYKQLEKEPSIVHIHGKMAQLTEQILNALNAGDDAKVISLQREYMRLSFQKDKMIQVLLPSRNKKTLLPSYQFIPLARIQRNMKHAAYLRYIIMKGEVGVVGINQDTAFYDILQISPDSLGKMVNMFYRTISGREIPVSGQDNLPRQAWNLFQVLFPPGIRELIEGKERLFITPGDFLAKLPFETLLTKPDTSMPVYYNKLPYLIKQYSIPEVAGISHFLSGRKRLFHRLRYAGFAPQFRGKQKLFNNIVEIKKIAKLLGGKTYTGSEANKKNFLSCLDSADIIQISTHFAVDMDNFLNSQLLFDTVAKEDNISLSDIYANKTNAGLIILSACQTGNGKLLQGEGIMSFAKTLEYSGAACVLGSIWDADDYASRKILCRFAGNINRKKNIESALRDAKLQYVASSDAVFAHPYYWANYQMQGDGTQTFPVRNNLPAFIIFSFILILLLVLWKADQ